MQVSQEKWEAKSRWRKESEPVLVMFEAKGHRKIQRTQGRRSIGGSLHWILSRAEMLRGSRQRFMCNHLSAGKVIMEVQREFPWPRFRTRWWERRDSHRSQTRSQGHSCRRDPVGMGEGELSLTERAECGGNRWKAVFKKGESTWVAVSLFHRFQPHRWPQSTFFQGASKDKRQFCSNFYINFDRSQSSPFPESLYLSCILQRIKSVCVCIYIMYIYIYTIYTLP